MPDPADRGRRRPRAGGPSPAREAAPALPPLPATPTGRYRHHKGNEYEVLGVVRHSETLEPMVLYRPLGEDTGTWVRPHAMFFETVEVDGRRQPRFARVEPPVPPGEAPKDDRQHAPQ